MLGGSVRRGTGSAPQCRLRRVEAGLRPPSLAPGQKLAVGVTEGAAGMHVTDRGGEELQEAELRPHRQR